MEGRISETLRNILNHPEASKDLIPVLMGWKTDSRYFYLDNTANESIPKLILKDRDLWDKNDIRKNTLDTQMPFVSANYIDYNNEARYPKTYYTFKEATRSWKVFKAWLRGESKV